MSAQIRGRFRDPLLVQGALAAFVGGICIGLFFLGYRDIPLKLRWTPVAALSFAAAFVGLRLILGPWLQLPSPGSRGSVRRQAQVFFLKLFAVYVASLGCMLLFVSWVYPLPFPGLLESVAKMTVLGLAGPCLVLGMQAATFILEAKQALARAEARAASLALQAQLQPHTIFNALNGIIASSEPIRGRRRRPPTGWRICCGASSPRWTGRAGRWRRSWRWWRTCLPFNG